MSESNSRRHEALQNELRQLKAINGAVSDVLTTIQTSSTNVQKLNKTTESSHKLLDKWIKILSQTHFTQEIILKTHWTGSSGVSDEDLEKKIQQERDLLKQLEELENENQKLEEKLMQRQAQEVLDALRRRNLYQKRQSELGLRSLTEARKRSRN